MKKFIAIFAVILLVGCMAFVFTGCGEEENEGMTSTTSTSSTTERPSTTNSGMITDVSGTDDNGALGDAITNVSEGLSEMMTDGSRIVSDIAQ